MIQRHLDGCIREADVPVLVVEAALGVDPVEGARVERSPVEPVYAGESEAEVHRAGAELEVRILDAIPSDVASTRRELQKRPGLEPGRRQHLPVAPHDATRLERDVAETLEPGALALVALDLDDLVEDDGQVYGERDPVDGGPAEEQVEALALVILELSAVLLSFFPFFVSSFARKVAAALPPTPAVQVRGEVAGTLGRRALGRIRRDHLPSAGKGGR